MEQWWRPTSYGQNAQSSYGNERTGSNYRYGGRRNNTSPQPADPLTRLSNNNMEVMVDIVAMVVGLLQDSHHRIMVVMGLAVVVLRPEASLATPSCGTE